MAARPPGGGDTKEPEAIEFGIAALDARIGELPITFPVEKETLVSEYGDISVPVDAAGTELRLDDALEEVPKHSFDTEQELLNTLHPVFERQREKASRSIIAQLRSLVPF